MDIGASLFLIALGAIFAFAVTVDLPGIDIQIIGWILMVVGAVGMLLSYLYWRPRRQRQAGGVVHEHHYVDDPSQPPPPAP